MMGLKVVHGRAFRGDQELTLDSAGPAVLAMRHIVGRFNAVSRRSTASRRLYATAMDSFFLYLMSSGQDPDVTAVGESEVLGYIAWSAEVAMHSATTTAKRLTVLKLYFDYCQRVGLRQDHPMRTLEKGFFRAPKSLPRAATEQEVTKILTAVSSNSRRDLRDRAIIELIFGSGLRISEALGLTFGNLVLDDQQPTIRVMGKGSKMRQVPVSASFLQALAAWLRVRPGKVDRRAHIFPNRAGGPFDRSEWSKCFKSILRRAGVDEALSPHKLRHAFAVALLNHGGDLRSIQLLLGHANLSTSEVYLKVSQTHVFETYRKAHPREGMTVPASR